MRYVLVLLLLLLHVSPALAEWPHLRGPEFDGRSAETGLVDGWPPEGPPVLWTCDLGAGYSGFVVADGQLFTQRQALNGQYLVCLDPSNGHVIWEAKYDWAWKPSGPYRGPYGSPTWSKGRVFCSSPSGLVCCFDAGTGRQLWSVNVKERFQGRGCDFGYAITPTIEGDRVIVPAGGPEASVVALNTADGRTIWTSGSDAASYCPIYAITLQGRRLLIGYLQNSLVVIDPETGKQLYHQHISTGYDEHSAWPIYREPDLLLLSPFRLAAKCLRLDQLPNGMVQTAQRWSNREFCNDVLSSVLHRDHVYGFDIRQMQASEHRKSHGFFKCVDWDTGTTRWTTDRVGHASLIVADEKLILFNDTGELILARADPQQYVELARAKLFHDEICWTPPALSHGKLFLRSPSKAICVGVGRSGVDAAVAPSTKISRGYVQSWRINPAWLLTLERDYPNDAPSLQELWLWFGASVIMMLAAATTVTFARRVVGPSHAKSASWTVAFFTLTFVLGFLGPNLMSRLVGQCLFTWPTCLYFALHATVMVLWRAERHADKRRARHLARLAVLGFLLVAYGYFELCRTVGMFIAWVFLFGLLPAFPFAVLAVRAEAQGHRRALSAFLVLLAFAVFFWSCAAFLAWKETHIVDLT